MLERNETANSAAAGTASADTARPRTRPYRGRRHTPTTVIGGTVGNIMEW